jgi:hypothetical protein
MVFRAFLEQRRSRPRRGRAHLGSALLHLAVLLLLLLAAGQLREEPIVLAQPRVLAVSLIAPRPTLAAPGRAAAATTGRKRAPRLRRPAAPRERPALVDPVPSLPAQPLASPPVEGPASEPALVAFAGGDGSGEGPFDGGGSVRGRRPELFARVIGGGVAAESPSRRDRPFVSLKEATALRTDDYFPRLPAALWPERGPYIVSIELCVSESGQVSDAELLSGASDRLDPVVLAAVRGWRYRPRLQAGQPTPFCHGVIIKYERHY